MQKNPSNCSRGFGTYGTRSEMINQFLHLMPMASATCQFGDKMLVEELFKFNKSRRDGSLVEEKCQV